MADAIRPKVLDWVEEEDKGLTPSEPAPPKIYDEQLVAFIDLLGTSRMIREDEPADRIYDIMAKLRGHVTTQCGLLGPSTRRTFLQLGDGFTIVADMDCLDKLCEALSTIQWSLLVYSGQLLRGAVTAGKVLVDNDFIVGPAFLAALTMERRNAIYPRIVFGDGVPDHAYIMQDADQIRYLDFIRHNIVSGNISCKRLDHLLTTHGAKDELSKMSRDRDKVVAQKYGWLISKLAIHGIQIV